MHPSHDGHPARSESPLRKSLFLALLALVSAGISSAQTTSKQFEDDSVSGQLAATAASDPEVLPLRVGVEINHGKVAAYIDRADQPGVRFVRYNAIKWYEVETAEGVLHWDEINDEIAELKLLTGRGIDPIVILFGTPAWAQQDAKQCGPIQPSKMWRFASFAGEVVRRLKAAGVPVRFVEIWNEPDAYTQAVEPFMPYGCWGKPEDPSGYYGGGMFGELLALTYPAIKAVDPNVRVVSGGLMWSCDQVTEGGQINCPGPTKFLEGILHRNGHGDGGRYFDLIGFHGYPAWYGTLDHLEPDLYFYGHEDYLPEGGMFTAKITRLKAVLAAAKVHKPVLMNEGGIVCRSEPNCGALPGYLPWQARMVPRLLTRLWARGAAAASWYTLNASNWFEVGLFTDVDTLRPAYTAYTFWARKLENATFVGPIASGQFEGYRFCDGRRDLRVYWTNREGDVAFLPPPAGSPVRYYNYEGTALAPQGQATYSPLLVESDLSEECTARLKTLLRLTPMDRTATSPWAGQYQIAIPGDWNGDGRTDVLLQQRTASGRQTYLATTLSNGRPGTPTLVTSAYGMSAVRWSAEGHEAIVGDWNGDGRSDLVLQQRGLSDETLLLLGRAAGGFETAQVISNQFGTTPDHWSHSGRVLVPGDWNGDGRTDLLMQQRSAQYNSFVLLGRALGGFETVRTVTTQSGMTADRWAAADHTAIVGDYDGDGRSDLVLQQRLASGQDTLMLRGNATGGFDNAAVVTQSFGTTGFHWASDERVLVAGDWNGDGRTDLVLQQRTSQYNSFLLSGRAAGGFDPVRTITTTAGTTANHWAADGRRLVPGDYDGDGRTDLVMAQRTPQYNSFLLLGAAIGDFRPPVQQVTHAYGFDAQIWSAAEHTAIPGDWNGDGATDLMFQHQTDVLQNIPQDTYLVLSVVP